MYPKVVGRSPSPNEVGSWRASLPRLEAVLRLARIPEDADDAFEEKIPYFSQRADVMLAGHDLQGRPHIIVVELKAWTKATSLPNGNVLTLLGGSQVESAHPCAQVGAYTDHLRDFCLAFHDFHEIELSSCSYCHNYAGEIPDDGLFDPISDSCRVKSPTFGEKDAVRMAEFLSPRLTGGQGGKVIEKFDAAGVGPSKQLIEHASEMIRRQNAAQRASCDGAAFDQDDRQHRFRSTTTKISAKVIAFFSFDHLRCGICAGRATPRASESMAARRFF